MGFLFDPNLGSNLAGALAWSGLGSFRRASFAAPRAKKFGRGANKVYVVVAAKP
jgi:hypothetical protein